MSPTASRVPSAWLPAGKYCCARCGRIATYSMSRPRPVLCRDCTEYMTGRRLRK